MRVGYMRVSTDNQCLDLQRDALEAARCDLIFEDRITGAAKKRPGLEAAMQALSGGGQLVVYRLDRLGRSLAHLIELITQIHAMGCEFQSLTEAIDTRTPGGKLIYHVLGALAEFDRLIIVERTKAGLSSARARGVKLGRRSKLSDYQIEEARLLLGSRASAKSVASQLGVGRATLYRNLNVRPMASALS